MIKRYDLIFLAWPWTPSPSQPAPYSTEYSVNQTGCAPPQWSDWCSPLACTSPSWQSCTLCRSCSLLSPFRGFSLGSASPWSCRTSCAWCGSRIVWFPFWVCHRSIGWRSINVEARGLDARTSLNFSYFCWFFHWARQFQF